MGIILLLLPPPLLARAFAKKLRPCFAHRPQQLWYWIPPSPLCQDDDYHRQRIREPKFATRVSVAGSEWVQMADKEQFCSNVLRPSCHLFTTLLSSPTPRAAVINIGSVARRCNQFWVGQCGQQCIVQPASKPSLCPTLATPLSN